MGIGVTFSEKRGEKMGDKPLNERVQEKMLQEGLSQRMFTKMFGINYTLLSDWLRNRKTLPDKWLRVMVRFLEMPSDEVQKLRKRHSKKSK